jgi:hypothetical protein
MAISYVRILSSIPNRSNAANDIELFGLTCFQNHPMNPHESRPLLAKGFCAPRRVRTSRKPASVQLNPKSDKGE